MLLKYALNNQIEGLNFKCLSFIYIYVDKRQALEIQSFYLVTNALIIKIGRRTPNKGAHKKTCMIMEDTHKKVFFLVVGRRTS